MTTEVEFTVRIVGLEDVPVECSFKTTFEEVTQMVTEMIEYNVKGSDPKKHIYVFYSDQQKTKRFDPKRTIADEKLKSGVTIYGGLKSEENQINHQLKEGDNSKGLSSSTTAPKILKVKIILNVQINQEEPISMELQTSHTLSEISDFYVAEMKQRLDKIHYQFFYDPQFQNRIDPQLTLMNAGLKDQPSIYGKGVYAEVKCIIHKNSKEVTVLQITSDRSIQDVMNLLERQNLHFQIYESLSITSLNGDNQKPADINCPFWKQGIYDTFTINFMIKVPVQALKGNQKQFKDQIVTVLNNGETIFYVEKVRLIEVTFHLATSIEKQIIIKKKEIDDTQTFTYDGTKVAFEKDGKGVFIFWKGGKMVSKFFVDD